MATPIEINGEIFRTKVALQARIRAMVAKYPIGEDLDAADFEFVRALLYRHPWCGEKVGVGIASFQVQLDFGGNRCLWLTRVDGTSTDFSWRACVAPPAHKGDVLSAMRSDVAWQTLEFRRSLFTATERPRCPITDTPLIEATCHVDHEEPVTFQAIVNRFLESCGLEYGDIAVGGYDDGQMTRTLIDQDLRARWQEFHATHARLRVLSPEGHRLVTKAYRPNPNPQNFD